MNIKEIPMFVLILLICAIIIGVGMYALGVLGCQPCKEALSNLASMLSNAG